MEQLSLLDLLSQQPATIITQNPSYTITHNPLAGFKVVLAPGLTSARPKNPCLTCERSYLEKDDCSEHCKQATARMTYLEHIGMADVAAVAGDGAYGFGC